MSVRGRPRAQDPVARQPRRRDRARPRRGAAVRDPQAVLVQGQGARLTPVPRAVADDRGRGAEHRVRRGRLPQHRRLLAARHRHVHDPGRHVHPPLRVLQRDHRQAHPQRPAGAAARGPVGEEDGAEVRGRHERRPRRPARPGLDRVRGHHPLDPQAGAGHQGRGADARLPRRGDAAGPRDRRAARRVQPQRGDRAAAVPAGPARVEVPALLPRAAEREGDGRRRGGDQVRPDDRPRRDAARSCWRRSASCASTTSRS